MGLYGGAKTFALFPTFDAEEMDYYVTTRGHFIIGLITSFPTQDEMRAFKFQGINTIRTSSLYGYTSVIDKTLDKGSSGSFDLSGYKGIYITNTAQGNWGDIVLTYQ